MGSGRLGGGGTEDRCEQVFGVHIQVKRNGEGGGEGEGTKGR